MEKVYIIESVYRAYELGDHTPKPELLPRLGSVRGEFGVLERTGV